MRRSTRTFVAGSAALGLAVGSLLWQAPTASAEPECLTSSSDFDRDGTPDIAVGIPGGRAATERYRSASATTATP